jgi:TP901 family phage tail tape measure protein
VDFTSSISLVFNDLFSPGIAQASQSLANLKTSLGGIGTTGLEDVLPQTLPQPDIPQPVVPPPLIPRTNIPVPAVPAIPKQDVPPPQTGPFDAGIKQIKSGLEQIKGNSALNTVATQLSTMAYMTRPLQNSLSGMMNEPSRLAGTFESSMKNIQAITGMAAQDISALGKKLRTIGGEKAAGPQGVAAAYNDVAGGITKLNAQMPVLHNAIALAESGQADLGVAANGLVKIMNSYNFTAGDTAEIDERAAWASDVMTQSVGMGVGSMNEFVTAMAPISGMAASVGVGFDEIGSTMAYMTSTTDTAATAGTKLQSFMAALQRPSDSLAQALAAVGITSGSAMMAEYGLAASAKIVSDAFNGDQDAIAQAMGRMEAMKAVVSLTGATYTEFASEFGTSMTGITKSAQAVQMQSYESKTARLQAATDAMKINIGGSINTIKGFFVDMGAEFLTHVANPIVSSPVGGVFRGIAAGVGIAAQGILSLGGGALNTAAQLSVLAANVKNFGGYQEMFRGALTTMGALFRMTGSGIAKLIGPLAAHIGTMIAQTATTFTATAAMWAAAGATWAALWPVLAVVGAVALVAGGVYLLIKNWGAVSGFFSGLWNNIVNAFTVAWAWIKGFFGFFWDSLKEPVLSFTGWIGGIFHSIGTFFVSVWTSAVSFFTGVWGKVSIFFVHLWDGIAGVVMIAANWFGGVWETVTGAFSAAWSFAGSIFASVWEGIKGVVLGFVEWLTPVIDVILAPFRAIGGVLDWIFDKAGKAVGAGNAAAAIKQSELAQAAALPAAAGNTVTTTAGRSSVSTAVPEISRTTVSAPVPEDGVIPASGFAGAAAWGAVPEFSSAALPAASVTIPASQTFSGFTAPAGALDLTHTASGAFSDALSGAALIPDMSALEQQVTMRLQELPIPQAPVIETPWQKTQADRQDPAGPLSVTIKNFTVQANDIKEAVDFYRLIKNLVHEPEEVPV